MGVAVADVQVGADVLGEDAGACGQLAAPVRESAAEDQGDVLGAAQDEMLTDHLLEELTAVERAVKDLGACDLELKDGELVGVARATVQSGEGVGQAVHPAVEVALDVPGAKAAAEPPQGGLVVDRGDAVVERLDVVAGALEVLTEPHVAVEADADRPGGVGAELDEAGSEVAVPDVEVEVLDESAVASGGEAAAATAPSLAWGSEDVGLLLGDADQDHALQPQQGGVGEVGLGDGLLALALHEVDDRDVAVLGEMLDGGDELAGDLAEQLVAGERLPAVLAEEPGELVGFLELGHVAV